MILYCVLWFCAVLCCNTLPWPLCSRSLETVSTEMASLFESTAKDLLETNDAVKVLSKALALVSGNTEIKTRSLLSSQAGYTTFLIRQNWQLRGTGLIWKMLNDDFSSKDVDQIRGMKLCKDKLVRAI